MTRMRAYFDREDEIGADAAEVEAAPEMAGMDSRKLKAHTSTRTDCFKENRISTISVVTWL